MQSQKQQEIPASGEHQQPQQQSQIGQVIAAANLMAGTTVNMRFIFGINTQVVNHLHFLEEHMIYYPAGHCVVFYNLQDRSQLFYQGQWEGQAITALAVSHNKKQIALAQRSEKALIAIFDTHSHRRKKVLFTNQIHAREYVSLAFNPTSKDHIIALTAQPDWTIILWEWQAVKPLILHRVGVHGVNQQLYQVSFHPEINQVCVVTGNGVFQYLKLDYEQMKVQTYHSQINQKQEHISSHYTYHIWLASGHLLIATNQGDLLLLQSNGQYLRRLPLDIELNQSITCIKEFSRGFIVGGDAATMWIFERSEANPDIPYKQHPYPLKSKTHALQKICCLAITPGTQEYIYFTLNNNQLMRTTLAKPLDSDARFETVICDFHSKQITGLDVCVRKSLFVTCSIDKSVRVWNYERRTLEICQNFSEEAHSCAFHPSGLHIVVGFADKIKLLNVFSKTLRTYKEFALKMCKQIRFAHGGHLFAAAANNSIQVYNFYTGEHPMSSMNFRMHPGRVRCIEWKEDDSGFISGDTQGALYQWNLKESQKREYQLFIKGSAFYGISKNPDGQQFFAVGNDRKIHVVSRGEEEQQKKTDAPMSQIVMSHNMKGIFALTSAQGRPSFIRCFKYPLSGESLKFLAHADAGERLRITHDDQFLISAGREGSLIIYNVNDKDAGLRGGKQSFALPLSQEVLTLKQQLEELNAQIVQLDSQNKDLENNSGNMKYEASIKELEQQIKSFSNQLNNQEFEAKKRHQELVENSRSKQNQDEDKMRRQEQQFSMEVEKLKADHASRMLTDNQNYQKQLKEREDIQDKFSGAKNKMISEHEQIVARKQEEHRMEMEKLNSQIEDQQRKILQMKDQHSQIIDQIQSDITEEKHDIIKKNEEDVNRMNEIALKSKADLQLANNKKTQLTKDIQQLQREIQDKETTLQNQETTTKTLRVQIKKQAVEIKHKDDTIGEKEKNIYTLKKKTQQLDKFKFVLDYKIKELKKAIGPRESKIQELKNKTNDMDIQLKKFSKINANFGLIVDDLRERQAGMQTEIKGQRTKIRENNNFIKKFKDDVYDAVQYIDEPAKLRSAMQELKSRYARDDVKRDQLDQDIKNEYQNQRQYLENSVNTLRKKLNKDTQVHKQDNRNIMDGNFHLLREIGEWREKLRIQKSKAGTDLGTTKTGTITSGMSSMGGGGGEKKQTKGKRDAIDRIVKERKKEIKIQEDEIVRLKEEVLTMRESNQQLREKKLSMNSVKLNPLGQSKQNQQ